MKKIRLLLLHVVLILMAAFALLPAAWLLAGSVKTAGDLFTYLLLPWEDLSRLTFDNYNRLLADTPFGRWFINSIFLTSTQTVLMVIFSSLGGFALARYDFRGKRPMMLLLVATMLLPAQVLLPSSYELMYLFGWLNTYRAILVPGAVSVFGMFLFRQAMLGVPDELLQAARVDGCGELRIWWDMMMPAVRPMTAAFVLMSFLASWNSYLWPQLVLQDEVKYPLPVGLANMVSRPEIHTSYGLLLAGTVLSVLPVMIVFFGLQRDFVSGLTSGVVK